MLSAQRPIPVYLEVGQKKAFAGALDWPGWCRSGRDADAALAMLVAYGPRYAKLFARTPIAFAPPEEVADLAVAERIKGDSSTDFGVAAGDLAGDAAPFGADERERDEVILAAIWRAFDRAVAAADGRELRRGPRGGGRQAEAIVRHLLDADAAYLRNVAQQFKVDADAPLADEVQRARAAIRAALRAGERGEIPERGPRGGKLWTPRYFVRRLAWHTLDHAWEIEDRLV